MGFPGVKDAKQVRNHATAKSAKQEIRAKILEEIGTSAVVFDAFAGAGKMFDAVWHAAGGYVGCDIEWFQDGRTAFVADNRRVLRAIDLAPFNIFDFDSYGSPWQQVCILIQRRKVIAGERLGLVLTEGSGIKIRQGGCPDALAWLSGMKSGTAGMARAQDDLLERAIAGMCRRWGVRVERRFQAKGKTGSGMRYLGMVLNGVEAPEAGSDSRTEGTVADLA